MVMSQVLSHPMAEKAKKRIGRPKGTPNKATKEIRAIAAKHGRKAIRRAVQAHDQE
jgi:hypothetical protein